MDPGPGDCASRTGFTVHAELITITIWSFAATVPEATQSHSKWLALHLVHFPSRSPTHKLVFEY